MSKYSIHVELSNESLSTLTTNKWQLQAFKGVKSSGTGKPTLWQDITTFSNKNKVEWEDKYAGYVDNIKISKGTTIDVSSNNQPMDPGEKLVLNPDGTTTVTTNDAMANAFTFYNAKGEEWVCGIAQYANNAYSPICVFDLYGHTEDFIEPYDKVVLVFSTAQVDTGSVVEEALSASIELTLSPSAPAITVGYDINTSWDTKGNPYAKVNPLPVNLAAILIIPQ